MRKTSVTFWLAISILLILMSASNVNQKRNRVVFFGDSITEAGIKPGGYIDLMNKMIGEQKLESNYELIGAGVSGNKIYDLYLRMETDVLAKKPNTVIIYVGVNDVWHKQSMGTGTDADKFEKFYQAIIDKLKKENISVVLCTPAAIGEKTDNTNQLDGDLNKYSNIIRTLAKKNQLHIIDLRKTFLDYNLRNNPDNKEQGILTTDRVHLNEAGNKMVAEEMLRALRAI